MASIPSAVLFAAAAAWLAAAASVEAQPRLPEPLSQELHRVDCWFDSVGRPPPTEFFFMAVPENPDDATSKVIAFPVIRFATRTDASPANPILTLGAGGPGNAEGLDANPSYVWLYYAAMTRAAGRDLYVLDPRGVGLAQPAFRCPDIVEHTRNIVAQRQTANQEVENLLSSYRECRTLLDASGFDPSYYNSRVVAQDVESLRNALNIDKWVLYGYSYAARYALTIARDFPDSVEAMVLGGPAFPGLPYTDLSAETYNNAFEIAYSWCEQAGSCFAASMRSRLSSLVLKLDESPIVITDFSTNIATEYSIDRYVLTGARLIDVLFSAFYDSDFFPVFADVISELEEGRTASFEEALKIWAEHYLDETFSDPILYSHYCTEEQPFAIYDLAFHEANSIRPYLKKLVLSYLHFSREICRIWRVQHAPSVEGELIETEIPTLFLQGALDPITPSLYLKDQLRFFKNYTKIEFRDGSHWGPATDYCAMKKAGQFIDGKRISSNFFWCRVEVAVIRLLSDLSGN